MASLVSCLPQPAPPPAPKLYDGVTLRAAAPADPAVRALLTRHGNAWSELTGARIEIAPSNDGAGDLVVFAPFALAQLVKSGALAPLPDSLRDRTSGFEFSTLLRPYRNHLIEWAGKNYALPLLGEANLCVYRADLLDDARHRSRIEKRLQHPLGLTGPATWQEFEAIAAYFHETPTWMPGETATQSRPSLPAIPDAIGDLDREFHAVAAPLVRQGVTEENIGALAAEERKRLLYDYQFDAVTGEPKIADPGFVEALSLLCRLNPCRSARKGERAAEALIAGRAVLGLVPLSDLQALMRTDQSSGMKFGLCRVPGSASYFDRKLRRSASDAAGNVVPYIGSAGFMAASLAQSARLDAALDFLTFVTGPKTSLEVVSEPEWGAGPTRQNQLELANRACWLGYGVPAQQSNALVQIVARAIDPPIVNPAYRLRIPNQEAYTEALTVELRAALDGKKEPSAALRDAARRWNELAAVDGKENLVRDYRLSVGLR